MVRIPPQHSFGGQRRILSLQRAFSAVPRALSPSNNFLPSRITLLRSRRNRLLTDFGNRPWDSEAAYQMQIAGIGRVVSRRPGKTADACVGTNHGFVAYLLTLRNAREQIKGTTRTETAGPLANSQWLQVTVLNAVTARIPITAKTTRKTIIWLARASSRPRGGNIPTRRRRTTGQIPVAVSS
jgi:hypothetical protein